MKWNFFENIIGIAILPTKIIYPHLDSSTFALITLIVVCEHYTDFRRVDRPILGESLILFKLRLALINPHYMQLRIIHAC